jgi:hypothetical protein
MAYEEQRLSTWVEFVEVADFMTRQQWVFRGHDRAEWSLQTSLEREFAGDRARDAERSTLWQFVRRAPQLLPPHLIPHDTDAAAWLGLIQHYGGPTRFLDVTRSPYIALFFAFEPNGETDRVVWAINDASSMLACAAIMTSNERTSIETTFGRVSGAQMHLVYSLVHGRYPDKLFESFVPFTGVFPVEPWKPDARQAAQQAMFLCVANPALSFVENLAANGSAPRDLRRLVAPTSSREEALYGHVEDLAAGSLRHDLRRFVLPASLREEALYRLSTMNVTAATLFPDLGGLARSLRTHPLRPSVLTDPPPWKIRSAATKSQGTPT